ncbi:unnamed protein product [Clavelina lepadiformis]|uniref:Protein phosphatase 1 regulatory subunit 15A/B C-terminal domain-containing protein n=1 Tax=Clavelina lepadiformis TaxID=159417 RepID=A0ABP0FK83_CLALP
MSEAKPAKSKILDWLYSVPATTKTLLKFTPPSRKGSNTLTASKSWDINLEIKKETTQVKDCLCMSKNQEISKRFPIQRLDSVGGVEIEQSRFSYPPTKQLDEYFTGNLLQSANQVNQNLEKVAFSSKDKVELCSRVPTDFVGMGSLMVKSLCKAPCKLTGNFTSLPGDLDTAGLFHDCSISQEMFAKQPKENILPSLSKMLPPQACLACLHVSCAGSCSSAVSVISDVPNHLSCSKIQSSSGGEMFAVNYDSKEQEITIMSSNCLKELQIQSDQRTPEDNKQVYFTETNNSFFSTSNGIDKSRDEFSNTEFIDRRKNPVVATLLGYESESDSDADSDISTSSVCDTDEDYLSSDDELESDENNSKNDLGSDTCFEQDDESGCPVSEEGTDSDDFSLWDRITSGRGSWTCLRNFSRRPHHNSVPSSDDKSGANCLSDNDTSANTNSINPICLNSTDCIKEPSIDSCYGSSELTSHSSESDDETENTVSRPHCENSQISFILGWSDPDSEDEQETDQDNDDVFSTNSCSETSLPLSSRCGLWSSESYNSFSASEETVDSSTPNTPSCSESAKLWDYFVRCGQQFECTQVDTIIRKSSCGPSLQNHCDRKHSADREPSKSENYAAEFYKAPTKVRFCDKVEIHPMVAWSFAYRQARRGGWECYARDRDRFKIRTNTTEKDIAWCLNPGHREMIYKSRFDDTD